MTSRAVFLAVAFTFAASRPARGPSMRQLNHPGRTMVRVTLAGAPALVARFRALFAEDPGAALRDWFVLQEHLRDAKTQEAERTARALARDLLDIRGTLVFSSKGEEAVFLHNAAVFFGSRGPAESLAVSLFLFEESSNAGYGSSGAEAMARLFHNRGNALQNLARSREDLLEALACYERALTVRDATRPIARGVTLHSLGLALLKLAAAGTNQNERSERLLEAVDAFEESLSLRSSEGLANGVAETAAALAQARRALEVGG